MRELMICGTILLALLCWRPSTYAQLIDRTQQPNTANEGIAKSFADEIGSIVPSPGHGSITTPGSSLFIINRDPFRAIRRGRQLLPSRGSSRDHCNRRQVLDARRDSCSILADESQQA